MTADEMSGSRRDRDRCDDDSFVERVFARGVLGSTEDAHADGEARRGRAALEALVAAEAPEPSGDFNERLRRRWLAEASLDEARPERRRGWLVAAAVLLVAAAGASVALVMGGRGVAWAEVVEAMRRVAQFRALVVEEDDGEAQLIEAFYKRPDTWRLHHKSRGIIAFRSEGGSGVFKVAERAWTRESTSRDEFILPDPVAARTERGDLIGTVLAWAFGDETPVGQPVPSAVEAGGGEMAVFDYEAASSDSWMRIWVLKSSRLPIRAKHYRPRFNDVVLMSFDYSDPQPDEFFDIEAFRRDSSRVKRPAALYRVGMQPIAGRPRDAAQVFETRGVRAPKVLEVVTNEAGHVFLASDRPENRSVSGAWLPESFHEELHDDRGNLYLRCFSRSEVNGRHVQHYVPVPPFVRGDGVAQLTVTYTAWSHHVGDPSPLGFDKVLGSTVIALPAPTVTGVGAPDGWFGEAVENPSWREQSLRLYLRSVPPLERLDRVDELLAESPDSAQLLGVKVDALFELGETEAADALFESRLRDAAFENPLMGSERLGAWLARRLYRGDTAGVLADIARVERRLAELRESDEHRRHLEIVLERSTLADVLTIPAALAALPELPKPRVVEVAQSEDGTVALVVEAPESDGEPESLGFHRRLFVDVPGWRELAELSGGSRPERRLVVLRGDGERLRVVFRTLSNPRSNMAHTALVAWATDVELPEVASRSAADLQQRFAAFFDRGEADDSQPPFDRHADAALRLGFFGRFEDALEEYRAALAAPDEDPLAGRARHVDPAVSRGLRVQARGRAALAVVDCLIELGRLDDAVDELERLTGAPDVTAGALLSAHADIISALVKRGELDEARARVETLERDRPDMRTLPNLHEIEPYDFGTRGLRRRRRAAAEWTPVDLAKWKLRQAEAAGGRRE